MAHVYAIDGVVPVVDPTAFVHPQAVLIGEVVIGAGCYIGPGASLRGDFGSIVIGRGCNVQDGCVLHAFPGKETVIEDDGHVGHGAVVHGAIVRRGVLIGMNSVVMDGVEVGEFSIVGAMAFVKAGLAIPPRSLVAGAPAKVLRPLSDAEIAWKAAGTAEYQALARRCLETLVACEPLTAMPAERPALRVGAVKPLFETRDGSIRIPK